jgi:thiol reductant ABC exporter CydC subunit
VNGRQPTDLPRTSPGWPVLLRLAVLVRGWWGGLALTFVAGLLNRLSTVALPIVGALLVVRIARGGTTLVDLTPFLVGMGAAVLAKSVFNWAEMWIVHGIAYNMLAALRVHAYAALEPRAPAYTLRRRGGDLVSMVMSDVELIETFFAHTLVPVLLLVLVPLLMVCALWTISPILAAALVPLLVVIPSLPLLARRAAGPLGNEVRRRHGVTNAFVVDSIQGLRELLAFGRARERVVQLREVSNELAEVQGRNAAFLGLMSGVTEGGTLIAVLAVLAVAGWLVNVGAIDRLQLPLVFAFALGAFLPVLDIAGVTRNLNQVVAAARRYFDVLDQPILVRDTAAVAPGPLLSTIEFRDVSFTYAVSEPAVLDGVSFRVNAGETVALVGPSGSGKSTCVNLLLRFWDPSSGAILLGGVDVRKFPLDDLRQRIAVVQQDNYLFSTTVSDNIRLGRPNASDAEVESAARAANAHDFIAQLPLGYATEVGERGMTLSGGQRQRLAIARAFLRNPQILVLDEATSNLDSENELAIRQAVQRLMAGRTTLLIAHRLSTILAADRVIMLSNGRVVADGRHHELIDTEADYARLLSRQSAAASRR